MKTLTSNIDASVNFVETVEPGQALEARYVRRQEAYFACYLSSQTACEKACRMCWLTSTGQNKGRDATYSEIMDQAFTVFRHYVDNTAPAKYVHFNFMARGEPLDSLLIRDNRELFADLQQLALTNSLKPRILISTIMPETFVDRELEDVFPVNHPEIYYSLYSMDSKFRRRWLPRAMDPTHAIAKLARWQRYTKKIARIHYALIKGENDSLEHASYIVDSVLREGLRADFTLVRYNPPFAGHSEESPHYESYGKYLRDRIPGTRVKIIDRVGQDVHASCGQFDNAY